MLTPKHLQKGDKIGIVAPARKLSEEEVKPAIKKFEEWGLLPVLGKNVFNSYYQFAGTGVNNNAIWGIIPEA